MVEIGKKAPDFILISDEGKKISLKDFRGKTIILYFYPKDNTSGCTKEACDFNDKKKHFDKNNSVVIGISKDNTESHMKFKKKYGLNFILLSDENAEIIKAYDVWKEKSMYGKKYMGIERSTFIINEKGFIKSIFRKVKVNGHIDEVFNELNK